MITKTPPSKQDHQIKLIKHSLLETHKAIQNQQELLNQCYTFLEYILPVDLGENEGFLADFKHTLDKQKTINRSLLARIKKI